MVDVSCFDELTKRKAKSFNQEKSYIKKALNGKAINCRECDKKLDVTFVNNGTQVQLKCHKGCTDILLDIDITV
ncbi:hypothetical protein ACOYR1_04670 [Thalassotalea piscium]